MDIKVIDFKELENRKIINSKVCAKFRLLRRRVKNLNSIQNTLNSLTHFSCWNEEWDYMCIYAYVHISINLH